jgi:lipopolysaccharide biosynthesis regulator YciM
MDALLDRADSMNRAYIPMTDGIDSLLLEATRYYDRHGDANQQMRAHYLLGCAYRDMGEAPMALQCYQDAVDKADTTDTECDFSLLSRLHST